MASEQDLQAAFIADVTLGNPASFVGMLAGNSQPPIVEDILGGNPASFVGMLDNNSQPPIVGDVMGDFIPHPLMDYISQLGQAETPDPSIDMLLGVIRNLRREKEMVEAENTILLRKLVTLDIQTEHVYLEVKRMVDHMVRVKNDIRNLRRNQETAAEIPNDPSYVDGARMVVSRFLSSGLVSVEEVRRNGFSLFMGL